MSREAVVLLFGNPFTILGFVLLGGYAGSLPEVYFPDMVPRGDLGNLEVEVSDFTKIGGMVVGYVVWLVIASLLAKGIEEKVGTSQTIDDGDPTR
ncbi:MAG: hypothetical protein NBV63_02605 [Candidatus Pacebacteria bacterium]|nr:hypothetical protein [Candidatus Paceibacterota bacterium]